MKKKIIKKTPNKTRKKNSFISQKHFRKSSTFKIPHLSTVSFLKCQPRVSQFLNTQETCQVDWEEGYCGSDLPSWKDKTNKHNIFEL